MKIRKTIEEFAVITVYSISDMSCQSKNNIKSQHQKVLAFSIVQHAQRI